MTSLAEGEMGPTNHTVERNHITSAAANPVKVEPASDHILRRGAKSEPCKASPPVDDPESLDELIDPFKSLHVDGTKEAPATESHSPDEDLFDESDSDWYTSDNDEGETKAYPPFSKAGDYSFDLANADLEIINRRYFSIPEPNDIPSNFCWGTDPRSPHISYLYEVRFTDITVHFYRHHMFNHSDSNDGPCPRAIGHHFFQPTGTIYRQKNGEPGYAPVEVYNDQQAVENYLVSQSVASRPFESLDFPTPWADSGLANQVIGNDQLLEFFITPPSSQDASLLSSPHNFDGEFPLSQDTGVSGFSRDIPMNLAPDQDILTSSQGSRFVYSSSNTSESSVCAYSSGVHVLQHTLHGRKSGVEEVVATPGASSSATDQSFDDREWPEDEDQVIRMGGLAPTVEDIDRYLKTFLKRLKEKKKTEVYCWDCRFGERRRSIEKSRQKYLKPSALRRHLMIHLKIETFTCDEEECDYVTAIEDNLNRHQDEVHKKSSRATKGRRAQGTRASSRRPARGDTIRPH